MHKRVSANLEQSDGRNDTHWLDLEGIADVEVTSEALSSPIEGALLSQASAGWRAGSSGRQKIRLHFRPPQHLTRIFLDFVETESERTQEYTLRWSADYGEPFREIVRQQWTFSPQGAPREIEDYSVNLQEVKILELDIIPDVRTGSKAVASLAQWRLA